MNDALHKVFLRFCYRHLIGLISILDFLFRRKSDIAVNYGGAITGDIGGPLVKVKRLRKYFPEQLFGYNLVYILSNAVYLPSYALNILKKRSIPIIYNQNGVFYSSWYKGDWKSQNSLMSNSYHKANYVFFQSEFCKISANKFLGERIGPGEILYNSVNTEFFKPLEKNDSCFPQFSFLLTGKFNSHIFYRLDSSVRALALARKMGLDCNLQIAGWMDEKCKASVTSLIEQLNIKDSVTLTGSYTQNQAPLIYQGANAYLMTKHNDPCPNTVIEAMACGLPVICVSSGGLPELVGDEAGVKIETGESWDEILIPDEKKIAESMIMVANKYKEMSINARKRSVEMFDIKHWVNRHLIIFKQHLNE
jgi:glycosyltransferase involved in cell wall biosynthesis